MTAAPVVDFNLTWGYSSAAVSVVFFGSSYIPVKKVEVGDGMVFQFIVCNTFMLIGIVVNFIQHSPTFYPFVMIGGAMTATANVFLPLIIRMIGIGVTTFIFGMFSLFPGWAVGRFGLLGVKQEIPESVIFNYIGIGLCALSGIIYMFIKQSGRPPPSESQYSAFTGSSNSEIYMALSGQEQQPPFDSYSYQDSSVNLAGDIEEEENTCDCQLSRTHKHIIGVMLAAVAGTVSGGAYIPVLYVMNNYESASQQALDYVFPHFSGAFLMSSVYFVVYAVGRGCSPYVNPRSILPAYISGILFGVAFVASLITNAILNPSISFPIITAGPPVITLLWSLLFREIRGKQNIILLVIGILLTAAGIAFVSVSKIFHVI